MGMVPAFMRSFRVSQVLMALACWSLATPVRAWDDPVAGLAARDLGRLDVVHAQRAGRVRPEHGLEHEARVTGQVLDEGGSPVEARAVERRLPLEGLLAAPHRVTLLVRLPRLLGGDSVRGEAMLREVLARDPNAFTTRLALANLCEARGDRQEALLFATRALQIAREQGRADKIAEAQATLAELRAAR